MKIKKTCRIN